MTAAEALIGQQVAILQNEVVNVPSMATICRIDPATSSLLLQLDLPIEITGVFYRYAVAASRLVSDSLGTLVERRSLGCAVTWVPDQRYNPDKPFDLFWWRGGAAAIADIMLLDAARDACSAPQASQSVTNT